MFKIAKKLTLNLKILRFFLIPTILISTPFSSNIQDAKAAWNGSGTKTPGIED